MSDALPSSIGHALVSYGWRRRAITLLATTLWTAAFVTGWFACVIAADRAFGLSANAVRVGLLVAVVMVVWQITRIAVVIVRPLDRVRVAAAMDRASPSLQERLATVVSQYTLPIEQRASAAMTRRLAEEVAAELAHRPPPLPWKSLRRPAAALLIAAIAAAAIGFGWRHGGR